MALVSKMLACLRGSSEDGLDGRRSAQSTPRLKRGHQGRHRTRAPRAYGSLSNVDVHRVTQVQPPAQLHQDQLHQEQLHQEQLHQEQMHQEQLHQEQLHQEQLHQEQLQQQVLRRRDHSFDPDVGQRHHTAAEDAGPHPLNQSWDCERVLGLDRSWEAERAKGLELLYRSVEREREREKSRSKERREARGRSRQRRARRAGRAGRTAPRGPEQWVMGGAHPDPSMGGAHPDPSSALEILEPTPTLVGGAPNTPDLKVTALERQVDQLNQQLQEERRQHRQDRLSMAKLQREVSRNKSDGPLRETLMKELDRERMLRDDAEQRLKDMTFESESTKQRLVSLQNEFKKMEEMVRSMVSYKHKIDALKQEKSNLITSYEASVAKYQTHVKNLDRENRMLLSEMKKLESQQPPAGGRSSAEEAESKTKVLLERLRLLEAENSALVLENETQRQQYERCLDSIANQVVQALLTQKGLREECGKLQKRVVDLEHQNRHLNAMFQQRIRFASDSVLQSALTKVGGHLVKGASGSGECSGSPGSSNGSYASLNLQQQLAALNELSGDGGSLFRPGGEQAASACSFDSIFSLHSICSDYNDQAAGGEDVPGRPEMSSPPPWLRDKVPPPLGADHVKGPNLQGPTLQGPTHQPLTYQVETEFPATNTSPKMKHVLHDQRHLVGGPQTALHQVLRACARSLGDTAPPMSRTDSPVAPCDPGTATTDQQPVKDCPADHRQAAVRLVRCPSCTRRPAADPAPCSVCASHDEVSPGLELLRLADSFNEQFVVDAQDGLPCLQPRGPRLEDATSLSEDAASRPTSHAFSAASTVSLNELLERELDDLETPHDETLDLDTLSPGDVPLPGPAGGNLLPGVLELPDRPVRDHDPDHLSRASSQSESSVLSQRPLGTGTSSEDRAGSSPCVSGQCSPKVHRPDSLALSQGRLCEGGDTECPVRPPSASMDNLKLVSPSIASPKHKLSYSNKSKSAKNLSCREHHPLKLYNVVSPPGLHSDVLERFTKVPPKVKPKPSIVMCLRAQTREEGNQQCDAGQPGPQGEKRCPQGQTRCPQGEMRGPQVKTKSPQGDTRCPQGQTRCPQGEMRGPQVKTKSPQGDTRCPQGQTRCPQGETRYPQEETGCVQDETRGPKGETRGPQGETKGPHGATRGPQGKTGGPQGEATPSAADSADPMTSSSSSGSPDSAMQQSFTSSSSDNTLSDKPSCRDDGYLSNSTISMSSNDLPGDLVSGQNIKRRTQPPTSVTDAQNLRRRSQPQALCDSPPAMRPARGNPCDPGGDKSKSLPAGLKLGPTHSLTSLHAAVSVESAPSVGKVRHIKAFFEGGGGCPRRPPPVGRCLQDATRRPEDARPTPPPVPPRPARPQGHTAATRGQCTQRLRRPEVAATGGARRWRRPRLRRCWSDTTLHRVTSDFRRDDDKSLQVALCRDWARCWFPAYGPARAHSQPLTGDQRRRSASPRLLVRRGQRSLQGSQGSLQGSQGSEETVRRTGEGAEDDGPTIKRPEAVGCASHQMAASYPTEKSHHWGRHRRGPTADKTLLGWSSESDEGSSSPPDARSREAPSPALPEWGQHQVSHQPLGIRRRDWSNITHPPRDPTHLLPPASRPEAVSPTAPQGSLHDHPATRQAICKEQLITNGPPPLGSHHEDGHEQLGIGQGEDVICNGEGEAIPSCKSSTGTTSQSEKIDSSKLGSPLRSVWSQGDSDESDCSSDLGPQCLTAEERAEMLDTLVTGGFSSSGGEDDMYLPHPAAAAEQPAAARDGAVVDRLVDGKQKVRGAPSFRKGVDKKTFVRYSEPEHHAIASFGFLEKESGSSSSSSSSDHDRRRANHRMGPGPQSQARPGPSRAADQKAKAGSTDHKTKVGPADHKAKAGSADRDKGRPANRVVQTIKDESRKEVHRLSTSSFEAASPGSGDLSLSDSCVEDFSSADSDSKA